MKYRITTTLGDRLLIKNPVKVETQMSWGPCWEGLIRDRRGYWTEGAVRVDQVVSMELVMELEQAA